MRTTAPHIQSVWEAGGPFIGDDAQAHSRVTVQVPWADLSGDHQYDVLRTTFELGVGIYRTRGIPLRWFQDAANDQVELEVPNVQQIKINRAVDQDAATFDMTLYNQEMFDNTASPMDADEAGQPGFYTFSRGVSLDSQARWGQTKNAWENLLVPNAILRTYQGYGGNSKTIAEAINDGNILITGTWFVDTVEVHSNGTLQLKGRDAAKLLLEQQLYPPLVPKNNYPLTYYRYVYFNVPVQASTKTVTTSSTSTVPVGTKITNYETSSVDAWYDSVYGHNMSLHGHHPSDAFDGNPDSYFLGEGNSRPDAAFAVNYLQATCGEQMNAVYVHTWGGNYTMYVSVMENGVWQGSDIVPYDYSELVGTQDYVVNTGANIPYVAAFGTGWETGQEYVLPRVYQADRVRITFRNLTYSGIGPWMYRAGVREFSIRGSAGGPTTSSTTSTTLYPLFIGADSHPDSGYVTSSVDYQIDAFGVARLQPKNDTGQQQTSQAVWTVRMTKTGNGYYLLTHTGRIVCYGDAEWLGDPQYESFETQEGDNCADMALSPSGEGYWVLDTSGNIWEYGDADPMAAVTPSNNGAGQTWAHSIDSHPTTQGVWVMDANGVVTARGTATDYGDISPGFDMKRQPGVFGEGATTEWAVKLRATSDGTGYWLMTSAGKIHEKGSAVHYGEVADSDYDPWWFRIFWSLLPHSDDSGYLVMRGDGTITDFGLSPAQWDYGSPIPGTQATQRKDGNYLDYSDIIKDLALWAGFLFYEPELAGNGTPSVHGNIESTGAYSYEEMPPDLFDKRPVIDPMHALKETVGYLLWVDEEGGLRFQSPNWWGPGVFNEDGDHLTTLPVLDESVTLIDYAATVADEPLRSMIIISSEDPDQGEASTITTRLIPSTAKRLRGLVKPAMWVNGYFLRSQEQKLMAELIALHTNFQSRVGQITIAANPLLQIDDQVRLFERQTADTYIHYVRGIDSTHNLDSGTYTMTVTTHWLGDETNWAVQTQGTFVATSAAEDPNSPNVAFAISDGLATALRQQFGSRSANQFDLGPRSLPQLTSVASGSQDGSGAAS